MIHLKHGVLGAILMTGMVANLGCSSGDALSSGSNDKQTRAALGVLSTFYGDYLKSHRGKPPQDSDAFQKYLETRSEDLKRYHVKDLDQIMTSPRDGQPFVIVCGKQVTPADSQGMPWAAYEQTGIDGNRMAVRVRGGASELNADEFSQIFLKK